MAIAAGVVLLVLPSGGAAGYAIFSTRFYNLAGAEASAQSGCGQHSPSTLYFSCVEEVWDYTTNPAQWKGATHTALPEWRAVDPKPGNYGSFKYTVVDFNYVEGDVSTAGKQGSVGIFPKDYGYNPTGRTTWGYTSLSLNSDGGIRTSTLEMNNNSSVMPLYVYTPTNPGFGKLSYLQVLIHELGHALGLDHPVARGPVVMQCDLNIGDPYMTRQPDDLRGELYLYSSHQADFGSPIAAPC